MAEQGWKRLLREAPSFRATGKYPIPAYSEFMPPPRLGCKPCGAVDQLLFHDDDPWGWHVSEYEESFELRAGLDMLARQLVTTLRHLGAGVPAHGIAQHKLHNNPYWPEAILAPLHERYVVLAPLALARTQDDKGRVRWTLFGGSEQGPAKGFWRGFYTGPKQEWPQEQSLDFIRRLIGGACDVAPDKLVDLAAAGFRVLPAEGPLPVAGWEEGALPQWTKPYLLDAKARLSGVKYLLTFRPLGALPAAVRKAYFAGDLHLLPFPGSLVFWGTSSYVTLGEHLPLASQIPLLHSIARREGPGGIRIPQSGWLHEPRPHAPTPETTRGPYRNTYQRTNRWSRVHRFEDELAVTCDEDKVAHVLFSTAADDLGLYGKPMARNAQLWTHDFQPLLDGPRAKTGQLAAAAERLAAGGSFGYRFLYPAMRVGRHEVYWQRPLVAYQSSQTGEPVAMHDGPLGYLTAYRADRPQIGKAIELFPRILNREPHRLAIGAFRRDHDQRYHRTTVNVRKLLETSDLLGDGPLEPSFARQLLTVAKHKSLEEWLGTLETRSCEPEVGRRVAEYLAAQLAAAERPARALTLSQSARRSFEKAYWNLIVELATGRYVNKDNADCVRDPATQAKLSHPARDLEALGDYILSYYVRAVEKAGMNGRVHVGELPFRWQTEFPFPWMGGWLDNQNKATYERDLVVVIPGNDRHRAVIMADHYDTAYMEDLFGYSHGGHGPRLSASGADDNHSATATLMLGAPMFMELSAAGNLECDVWLVHLTGEEFPSDCMGARHLCQRIVEKNLSIRLADGSEHDLSKATVEGVYVLDMVAHNNDKDRDVFQICPGSSRASMRLAWQAHVANRLWNQSVPKWNQRADRVGAARGKRSADGATMPEAALHPELSGEVRPPYDPRSTLYNTDGQIFSDAGVPVVLFMENYDINRQGYHDTHDNMTNIDLDYGSAVAAIAIESVARAACEKLPTPPGKQSTKKKTAARAPRA